MLIKALKRFVLLLATLQMCACAPTVTTRGNLLSPVKLQMIMPGTSTRADVATNWGPPTTIASFDQNIWYYIGETNSQQGIFAPEVEKRQTIRVTFNTEDVVVAVEKIDPKLAQNIEPVDRRTPTAGKDYTAVQQLIGNLGKFNTDNRSPANAGP